MAASQNTTFERGGCLQLSQSRKKAILGQVRKQRRRRGIATIVVVAILIAVIVGGIYAFTARPAGSGLPGYLDICVSGFGRFYHAHPHLSIVIDGQDRPVQGSIGLASGCLRPLHTHAADGVIHVEPDDGSHPDYTLKDFFLIWGQPLNSTHLLDRKTDSTHAITFTVNGSPVAGALESYQLPRDASIINEEECNQPGGPPCQYSHNLVLTYGPST